MTAPAGAPEGEYAVSLKWTALEPGTTAAAIFALNVGAELRRLPRAAAQLFDVPAQNLVYADVDGNIGYQTPGKLPIRGAGDGSMPQPGGTRPTTGRASSRSRSCRSSFNPPEGYIVTANNAIVGADYPYFLTRDWDYGWRAARIVDLLQRKAAMGTLTADDMRDIQADNDFAMGKRLAAAYMDIVDRTPGTRCRARPAAVVGCAERRRTRMPPPTRTCCGTSSCGPLRHAVARHPAPGHRPGSAVPRRRRAAR